MRRSLRFKAMIPRPLQCNNCLRYGHSQKFCRQKSPRCAECSGAHATLQHANIVAQLDIANRGRPEIEKKSLPTTPCWHCAEGRLMEITHRANDPSCPIFKREQDLQEEAYVKCCSRQDVLKRRGHLRRGYRSLQLPERKQLSNNVGNPKPRSYRIRRRWSTTSSK